MNFERRVDVVVAGAGVAGIAAALEAARAGCRTALLEKTILPGGLATSGLVNVFLPLCDGNGTQVTFGMAEELLQLSLRYGPGEIPARWRDGRNAPEHERYRVIFSPASFMLALDEVLQDAGVEIWYDTLICATQRDGDRVTGVEVENKSGRGVLHAACIIDATGDADVAARAGAECVVADNWLSLWAIQASLATARTAVEREDGLALVDMFALGGDNAGRNAPDAIGKMDGTDGAQVTRFVLEGRRLLREYFQQQYAGGHADRHTQFPMTLPTMAQFRTTRRIVGMTTLTDGQHGQSFTDAIGLVADWRKAGSVWEIPYGTLVPCRVKGVLAAGRCISSGGDAWEVTRVIPAAAMTGQMAGLAASLAIAQGITPDVLDPDDIQRELRARGIPYHLADLPAAQTI